MLWSRENCTSRTCSGSSGPHCSLRSHHTVSPYSPSPLPLCTFRKNKLPQPHFAPHNTPNWRNIVPCLICTQYTWPELQRPEDRRNHSRTASSHCMSESYAVPYKTDTYCLKMLSVFSLMIIESY